MAHDRVRLRGTGPRSFASIFITTRTGQTLFQEGEAMPSRREAWDLLCEWTPSENLRKHALAVEACLRGYARKLGADEELWGLSGLLHDFDYERWPNADHHPSKEHPYEGSLILRVRGYPDEMIHAILAHADYSGVERVSALDHALFACDELSGFLTACALVKPTKSIHEVETSSVKKKLKDKAFARGVNRGDVYKGAEELGIPLDDHISFCIDALRGIAVQLGLSGTNPI
jgi:putative nucleotidyltransferase with HDIG domain